MKKLFYLATVVVLAVLASSGSKRPVTLFMVGDSTMADKEELEASPERGWGQVFPTFLLKEGIVVENHARNGRSTKSFIDEGRWEDVLARVQRGDVVLIQFGHNDPKKQNQERYSDLIQFRANLTRMVNETRKKGATPILATPVVRRCFDENGVFVNTHGAYPEAVRTVAKVEKVPLLDMEQMSREWIVKTGVDASADYYMNLPVGKWSKYPDGKEDNTHFQEAGALMMAGFAAQAIETGNVSPLVKFLCPKAERKTTYTTPCTLRK